MTSLSYFLFIFVLRKRKGMGNKGFVLVTKQYLFLVCQQSTQSFAFDIPIDNFVYNPIIEMRK